MATAWQRYYTFLSGFSDGVSRKRMNISKSERQSDLELRKLYGEAYLIGRRKFKEFSKDAAKRFGYKGGLLKIHPVTTKRPILKE